jgi:hypothetical protein
MWGTNVELMILNQRGVAENPARQSGEGKSRGVLKREPAAAPQTGGGNAADVDGVVSDTVMGLAFGREGKLYATDFTKNPGLYLIDIKTGFETAIAALPFGFSSGLELVNPSGDQ